jgi:hypothetical protein
MRHVEAFSYIRQIAAMGLPPHDAIPLMMGELCSAVRSENSPFFWSDPHGFPVDMWIADFAPSVFEAEVVEMRSNRDPDAATTNKIISGPRAYNNTELVSRLPGWANSVIKNELFKYYNVGESIDFSLRDNGVIKGMFAISRPPGSQRFSSAELKKIRPLVQHFVHALSAPARPSFPGEGVSDGQFCCLIVGYDGTILSHGPGAEDILFKLSGATWGKFVKVSDLTKRVPLCAMEVIDRLRTIQSGATSAPASTSIVTRWGLFKISAHPLTPAFGSLSDTIAMTIQPVVSLEVARLRRIANWQLSPSERRVALRMAGPGEGEDIAKDVGLTLGSYRQIAKRIYATLGIEGRAAVKLLLNEGAAGPI